MNSRPHSLRPHSPRPLSRRSVLRGAAGALISLPFLEALTSRSLVAAEPAGGTRPIRLLWLHSESGIWMPQWKPTTTGTNFALTPTLEPLAPYRSEISVLSGLFHANAFKRNAQAGRHVQDGMCHLTATDLGGTPGVAVKNGISVDQLAAETIGEKTRVPVLNLSIDRNATMSFSAGGTPVPVDWDPREIFSRLFADNSPDAKKLAEARYLQQRSVLDDVMETTRDLSTKLGTTDRQKLDEYLSTVREVERRATVTRTWADRPAVSAPEGTKPPGPPPDKDRTAYVRLLMDLMVLALQTDQTRLATLRLGFMGCMYPDIGCPDSYHNYTHHDFKADKQAAMAKVDQHRIAHLAYFLGKLKAVKEGEHDLLHHCVIHYGTGMGADHETTDLANLVIGRGGGALKPGQHLDCKGKPLADLYVRMMATAGMPIKVFADSSGALSGL
ncbi:MAG: DUF1552 domain-containing protein [Planctomycetes bacterium]|nr:DUF1552 domain-containing protein [Planctomycetota bacterium]